MDGESIALAVPWELARAGKTLEAMTRYRALTNASAADARSVVMGLG